MSNTQMIPVENLVAHPLNANRMSKSNFNKLIRHIKTTGRYEPIVVRRCPNEQDKYQIINGHHRTEALRQIGHKQAMCVVWEVDDAQTLVLLQTLNRLCGRDELQKQSELIAALSKHYEIAELAEMLPQSRTAIERIKALYKPVELPKEIPAMPKCMVFYLDDGQYVIVENALAAASADIDEISSAKRKAAALVQISRHYNSACRK